MKEIDFLQNLEKLRGFAAVAKLGGFHKASRELRLSQPGLSRSIDILESVIGKKLLIRSVKGVTLTDEGKLILAFYEKTEALVGDLTQKIKAGNSEFSGEIRVASYETLCSYLWPDFLKNFGSKYPELKIILETNNEKDHWNKLNAGIISAVVDAEPTVSHLWDSYVLYRDHFNFYVSPEYKEKKDQLDMIYVEKAYDEDHFSIRDHLVKSEIQFQDNYKLDSFLSVRAFAIRGLGIGILPERLVKNELINGQLKKINIKGFSDKGFGKHRICFSVSLPEKNDSKLKLLKKELRLYLKQG